MAEKDMNCLRCGAKMRFLSTEKLQLGQASLLIGLWGNLAAGSLRVGIYGCPDCGKLEFFSTDGVVAEDEATPQRTCPNCGKTHDFDYPRCPFCGHDYY